MAETFHLFAERFGAVKHWCTLVSLDLDYGQICYSSVRESGLQSIRVDNGGGGRWDRKSAIHGLILLSRRSTESLLKSLATRPR